MPAGLVTLASTTSRKSSPVTRSSSSASTQWADDAWYSKRVPGSQLSRQRAKASQRPALVSPAVTSIGACGKPAVWRSTCSRVMTSLPFVANSGISSTTRWDGSRRPSPITAHTAPATRAFVVE